MDNRKFRAMVVSEAGEKQYKRQITDRTIGDLPEGDVLVKVLYSSLNYKDALSAIGNKGVTRNFPHTPGVDASGLVEESESDEFNPGDEVIVHCYDLGQDTDGGFGQYIRVPAKWVVRLPEGMSLRESMIYGTAGFTAAHCLYKLQDHGVKSGDGEILVTGATGGVGSTAVAMLSKAGYDVVASTGKTDQRDFLLGLGAKDVISREESVDKSGKPLLKGKWAGVVDTVGGDILAAAISSTLHGGIVTCCGNVGGHELNTNVYPFILRGIELVGIDSANCPMDLRVRIWERMSREWKLDNLEELVKEISLDELSSNIDLILQGKQKGRVLLNLWK